MQLFYAWISMVTWQLEFLPRVHLLRLQDELVIPLCLDVVYMLMTEYVITCLHFTNWLATPIKLIIVKIGGIQMVGKKRVYRARPFLVLVCIMLVLYVRIILAPGRV